MRKRDILILLAAVAVAAAVALTVFAGSALPTGSWGLSFRQEGQAPIGNAGVDQLKRYDAMYIGDTQEKVLYLTFDAGYENGCTAQVLDTLKAHNVTAAFFLVGNYIQRNADLVRRMAQEGHIVGNHTMHHYDMSKICGKEAFSKELKELEDLYTYRTALEGYCACQAAKKRTTSRARALLNKLRQQYQAQKAAYDIGEPVERWVELDFAFHGALIDYLANEEFSASMERLRTRLVLLEKFSLVYCEGRMERVLEEHRSIIEAIASGQTDDVMYSLEGHFNRCRDVLITLQKEPKP